MGGTSGQALNEGTMFIRLKDPATRRYYIGIMTDLRQRLKRYPALRTAVSEESMGGTQAPIQISLRGDDLNQLRAYGVRLLNIVKQMRPARLTWIPAKKIRGPRSAIDVDRKKAGDLGLDLGTVATTVRGLVAGQVVSQFEDPDGDTYDVRLRVEGFTAHPRQRPAGTRSARPVRADAGASLPGGFDRYGFSALQDPPPRPDAGGPHLRQHPGPLAR